MDSTQSRSRVSALTTAVRYIGRCKAKSHWACFAPACVSSTSSRLSNGTSLMRIDGSMSRGRTNAWSGLNRLLHAANDRFRVLTERRHPQRRLARFACEADRRIQMTMSVAAGQQHAARLGVGGLPRLPIVEHRHRGNAAWIEPAEPVVERAFPKALCKKLPQRVL